MTLIAYALLAAVTSSAPVVPGTEIDADRIEFAQLRIQQRVIVRIPARPSAPLPMPVRWREKRGPRCIAMAALGGAAVSRVDAVDLYLRGGPRIRAVLEDRCPALDYYSGFYILPTSDGMICADRDRIRTRAGGECGIERFRTLVPDR